MRGAFLYPQQRYASVILLVRGFDMSFVSSASVSSASIVICMGDNEFPNSFHMEVNEDGVECGGFDTRRLPEVASSDGGSTLYHSLSDLIEVCIDDIGHLLPAAKRYVPATQLGDITQPEAKIWNYSKDVLSLARNSKQQEVRNSKELLFGVELEFNHSAHSLQDLYPLLGMGIFKSDSSVDGEYVTLPYTYQEMVSKITEVASSFDKLLSANDTLTPHSGVGMHVHLSRKGLSNEQLELLRCLFGYEPTTPHVAYLCGRYPNKWCRYTPYKGGRYVALNEANRNTVEIRAFLSPKDHKELLHKLALVKAMLDIGADRMPMWDQLYPQFAVDNAVVKEWWGKQSLPAHGDFDGDEDDFDLEDYGEVSPVFDQGRVQYDQPDQGYLVAVRIPLRYYSRAENGEVLWEEMRVTDNYPEYGWHQATPLPYLRSRGVLTVTRRYNANRRYWQDHPEERAAMLEAGWCPAEALN